MNKQPTPKQAFDLFTKAILSFTLSLLVLFVLLQPVNILLVYLLNITISYGYFYLTTVILSILFSRGIIDNKESTVKEDLEKISKSIKLNLIKIIASLIIWGIAWFFYT